MWEVCSHWREPLVQHTAKCHAYLHFKQKEMPLSGAHTLRRRPFITCRTTHDDMHLPVIYIFTHVRWRTHTNRAGLTGYSSCCFPDQTMAALLQAWQTRLCQGRGSEIKREREGERKEADREIEWAEGWRKAVNKTGLAEKKESEKEKERDPLTHKIYCQVLQGLVSIEVAAQKLYFITWIWTATCKETQHVHVIACLLYVHDVCKSLSTCEFWNNLWECLSVGGAFYRL